MDDEQVTPRPEGAGMWDMHDVAAYLKVDISWVKNHCSRVKPILPHYRFGTGKQAKRRFNKAEIDAFISENVAPMRCHSLG